MLRVISHEAKKSFSNAAQALECILVGAVFFAPCGLCFLNFVLAFLLTHNRQPNLFYRGEIATKIVTK